MREIKFRAIQRGTKKFIYGDLCKFMDNSHCIMPSSFFATRDFGNEDNNGNIKIENCLAIGGFYPVDSETVGQFTGLKDKNKVDIYDGDILSYSGELYEIVFQDYAWMMGKIVNDNFQFDSIFQTHWNLTHNTGFLSEIIGNIHQNKELIKQFT